MGPGARRMTSSFGFCTERLRSRIWWTREKIAVLAPMPRAKVRTAMELKPGFFASIRAPKRMSCHRLVTRRPPYRLNYSDEVSGPDVLKLIREIQEKVRFAARSGRALCRARPRL